MTTWWSEWLQIWSPNDRVMTNTITLWLEWLQVWSPNDRVITNMITWSYEGLPNCAVCAIHNLQGDFCDLVVIVKTTKKNITKMMLFKILALLWLSSSFTLIIAIRKKRRPTITWKWQKKIIRKWRKTENYQHTKYLGLQYLEDTWRTILVTTRATISV